MEASTSSFNERGAISFAWTVYALGFLEFTTEFVAKGLVFAPEFAASVNMLKLLDPAIGLFCIGNLGVYCLLPEFGAVVGVVFDAEVVVEVSKMDFFHMSRA